MARRPAPMHAHAHTRGKPMATATGSARAGHTAAGNIAPALPCVCSACDRAVATAGRMCCYAAGSRRGHVIQAGAPWPRAPQWWQSLPLYRDTCGFAIAHRQVGRGRRDGRRAAADGSAVVGVQSLVATRAIAPSACECRRLSVWLQIAQLASVQPRTHLASGRRLCLGHLRAGGGWVWGLPPQVRTPWSA